jgi:hypothetical protein
LKIGVLNFYRNRESRELSNPFISILKDPTFYILACFDGKIKELALEMAGDIECPTLNGFKDFRIEGYRNYLIITNYLLGENGERVRLAWGLSKEDFRELIFELYFTLVKEHTTCSLFKKGILVFIGLLRFYFRKRQI